MSVRAWLAAWILVGLFVSAAPAAAQDDDPSAASSDDAAFEASLAEGDTASAPARPTVLVVGRRGAPDETVSDVRDLLREAGTLLDATDYEREARARGLPPESAEAMAAILPDMHPDLSLVVVVDTNRPTRATLVLLSFHDRFGLQILEEVHGIEGRLLTPEARSRTLAETRLALAVITRPTGGLQEVGGGVEPGERAPGLAVHVAVSAGAGVGTRQAQVPTPTGVVGLGTAVFAAAAVALAVDVEPVARGQFAATFGLEYQSSLGWVLTDVRVDDARPRDTGARSQRLAVNLGFTHRLEEALDAVSLGATLGWSALTFSTEAPVSLPDYTLQGPTLALGVSIPIADGLLGIDLWPEATWLVDAGGLGSLGVVTTGVALGGSARLRMRLLPELFAELAYRETHAFLDTETQGGAVDVERFATARLVYRP